VQRIVTLSSMAASSTDSTGGGSHLAVEASGLGWTHIRPGAFDGNALWQWGPSIRAEGKAYGAYPAATVAPVHEADIAAAAVTALLSGKHHGQRYELTGPESLTYRRQVAILGETLGRPIPFIEQTSQQARQQMTRHMPGSVADALLALWAKAEGKPATVLPTIENVTGHPARTFAQWATEHASDFQ
jgi:uncharacterized protein YbjT (DUF2867 family)